MPSVEKLRAQCAVFDLDFYVGPRRPAGAVDQRRLREAVASTERALRNYRPAFDPDARTDAIAAVYDLLDRERSPSTAQRVKQLIDALGRALADEPSGERSDSDSSR